MPLCSAGTFSKRYLVALLETVKWTDPGGSHMFLQTTINVGRRTRHKLPREQTACFPPKAYFLGIFFQKHVCREYSVHCRVYSEGSFCSRHLNYFKGVYTWVIEILKGNKTWAIENQTCLPAPVRSPTKPSGENPLFTNKENVLFLIWGDLVSRRHRTRKCTKKTIVNN